MPERKDEDQDVVVLGREDRSRLYANGETTTIEWSIRVVFSRKSSDAWRLDLTVAMALCPPIRPGFVRYRQEFNFDLFQPVLTASGRDVLIVSQKEMV